MRSNKSQYEANNGHEKLSRVVKSAFINKLRREVVGREQRVILLMYQYYCSVQEATLGRCRTNTQEQQSQPQPPTHGPPNLGWVKGTVASLTQYSTFPKMVSIMVSVASRCLQYTINLGHYFGLCKKMLHRPCNSARDLLSLGLSATVYSSVSSIVYGDKAYRTIIAKKSSSKKRTKIFFVYISFSSSTLVRNFVQ
ncbi:uncharacterized protein EV154DRAFT_485408 [Mucor mucedo]|uniref:uncharacterized protein n=1 Tax=Mucor mucedo TaxID=29922 RepID=UPI002220A0C4|nr:uncharacterized protein EV154DRAFT_485408 [Mucor mucedo]KAI7884477.1 hypothetical protein EV154DRAFT_485408 [Mucor mucedo]